MRQRFLDWLDHRTGYRDLMREALDEPIPGGSRWRFVWGSTLVFAFFVQVVTGFVLWAAYSPSTRTAWESVYYIQHEMTLGWLVRGIHHFAAQAMVILLVFHLVQVVIDGAYRAPREVNFWLGLILMQIVLGLGLTGYLLPWDQKGYYATQVATEIMGSTPLVGPAIQKVVQGGSEYGHHTLTRFFALHAGLLPALLVGFLFLHIYVFRRHAIHVKDTRGKPDSHFWPDQVLKDSVACLAVLAAVIGLAVWKGAELTAPANPAEAYSAARPEWYYLFLFRFLKFEWVSRAGEATHLGEALGAVVLPGVLMLFLVLMPIIAYLRGGHRFNIVFLWALIVGSVGLTGVAMYEDWFEQDADSIAFRHAVATAHRDGARAVELAQSPGGIPPEGAVTLLRNDPLTQGPKIFHMYCAECHQPGPLDEASAADLPHFSHMNALPDGSIVSVPVPQTAATLTLHGDGEAVYFGTRRWIGSVLKDFRGHFQSLENITPHNGATPERAEAADAILNGSMADWSESNGELLFSQPNQADAEALIEFVYAQSGRPDALPPEDPRVQRGREIFQTGELADGTFDSACIDCHALHARGDEDPLSEDLHPVLTGYGGREWIYDFVTNPPAVYAGDDGNNAMPAFGDQLSPHDLQMLVDWLTGEYYRTESASH